MKNIQVIDGAENCTYDIFQLPESDFEIVFPNGTDIEFIDDLVGRIGESNCKRIMTLLWAARVNKKSAVGIHGTLFFELGWKKKYYPTKKEKEMIVSN